MKNYIIVIIAVLLMILCIVKIGYDYKQYRKCNISQSLQSKKFKQQVNDLIRARDVKRLEDTYINLIAA